MENKDSLRRDWSTASLFRDKFASACREVIHTIDEKIDKGGLISRHYWYPSLKREGLFPSISGANAESNPLNYRSVIKDDSLLSVYSGISKLPFVRDLVDYCANVSDLREYFSYRNQISKDPKYGVCELVLQSVDHYLHISNFRTAIEDKILKNIINQIQIGIYSTTLPIWILVPLPYTNFYQTRLKISDSISIIAISNRLHMLRCNCIDHGSGATAGVVDSANFALLLKSWTWSGNINIYSNNELDFRQAYPIANIERIFSILRLCWPYPIGFSQICTIPRRWSLGYKADLPNTHGTTIRRYPSAFDELNPMLDSYFVGDEVVKEASELMTAMDNVNDNRFEVALRRFSTSLLRDSREDSIIDSAIGIEALMSDDKQEISHKIALRIAALSQLDPYYSFA